MDENGERALTGKGQGLEAPAWKKEDTVKYSTGRGTRTKHSTAIEWDEYERRKQRGRSKIRYSTGRDATLLHSSGTITDNQVEENSEAQAAAEAEDAKKEKQPSNPSRFKSIRTEY